MSNYNTGPKHPRWTGDNPGYRVVAQRRRYYLGKASLHQCIKCYSRAKFWSLTGPTEYRDAESGIWYSTHHSDYSPMCGSHHQLNVKARSK